MKTVLVLCTGNSARSQMAEGLLRFLSKGLLDVNSAGTKPSSVNPLAIKAMADLGIDISGHSSKSVAQFSEQAFDYVITVCDKAKESCPIFPNSPKLVHWSLPDPAAVKGSEEEKFLVFKQVRDDLKKRLSHFLTEIDE